LQGFRLSLARATYFSPLRCASWRIVSPGETARDERHLPNCFAEVNQGVTMTLSKLELVSSPANNDLGRGRGHPLPTAVAFGQPQGPNAGPRLAQIIARARLQALPP